MFSRKTIEAYLFFLLRHKLLVSAVVAVVTAGLAFCMWSKMHIFTNFFDLYPPGHPYIQLYQQYRNMFGTANQVVMVVEVQNGTIYDDPATVQKVERITLELLHDVPGVNGEQVMSITHPKLKTTLTAGSGIKVVPLTYPRVPENKEDLRFLRQKIRSSDYQGVFVSDDDKATMITAGFWEEYYDLPTMWKRIQEMVARESDANTKIYVTGIPVLYAYFLEAGPKMVAALAASIAMIMLILWVEFRSWQGLVIPIFSGTLSAIWGLGFGGLCAWASQFVPPSHPQLKMLMNVSMDPLVLVIPLLISARAHSHSVQSMERYHEEYHRLRDKDQAIVKSYTEIYAPAMVSLLADGLATLTLLVARIPLIQKLAILCSFWIISIFVSVVTLHPIILAFTPPPREFVSGRGALERFMAWMMAVVVCWLFWLYGHWTDATWLTLPFVGPIGPLGIFFGLVLICGLVDALTGMAPPVYGYIGVAVCQAIDAFGVLCGRLYYVVERTLIYLAEGWRRPAMLGCLVALLSVGLYYQHKLKVGDATPGGALLYRDHPHNVAFRKVNEKFTGASQLVVIAEGAAYCAVDGKACEGDRCVRCDPDKDGPEQTTDMSALAERAARLARGENVETGRSATTVPKPRGVCGLEKCLQREGTLKDAEVLNGLDLFARYMAERQEVGGTVTAASILKKIFRTFHEAEPKWEILPTRNDHVAQLFFLLTSNTRRGEMDNFFDSNYANATVTIFYKDYTHETIENSIARAKEYIAQHASDSSAVRYRLAGGIIGILAAVNEEVEWSYRVNLALILTVVFLLSYATYVSVWGALIVMLPSLVAQPLSECVMYLFGIDMNINSLPVAAIGIGIGIDYGYYVLSRIVEELAAGYSFEIAIRRMFETTGKTVLFTGVSLTASIIFWVFFPMKFQADMALLLVLLLAFHLAGALIFIPPMVALFRPRFAIRYAEERARLLAEQQAASEAAMAAGH